jgi:hypothetical protein
VHEGGFTIVQRDDGTLTFYRLDGTCVEIAPRMHRGARPFIVGVAIGPCPTMARADRTPLDVAWAIDILRDGPPVAAAKCRRNVKARTQQP